jgi:flagellar hook-length control protein FliK
VREQDVPQDTQPKSPAAQPSDAPQAKTVIQLSNQAMDAIAAAAKGQKPEAVASNPIPQAGAGSISALLNAVRGTITAIANPKQAAARADLKPDPKNVVASGARPVPPPSADDHKASTAPVAQHDDTDRGLQSGRPTADDTTRTSSTPEKAATPETAIPTRLAPTATQAVPDGDVLAPFAGPTVSSAASTAPANASDKSASGGNQLAVPSNISALASAIAAKSAAGTKTFDIRMDPPELGRVDVHLSVDSDGKVQASLHAEHPQTLALLQRDSQNLERALKDAGLNLSHNSLNFSLKGEQRQGDGGGASMARSRSLSDAVVARAEAANASEINLSSLRGNGRLDIRV